MTLLTNSAFYNDFTESIMHTSLSSEELLKQLQKQQPEASGETFNEETYQEIYPEEVLNFFTQFSYENNLGTKIYRNSEEFLKKVENQQEEVFEAKKEENNLFDDVMDIKYFKNKIQELKN